MNIPGLLHASALHPYTNYVCGRLRTSRASAQDPKQQQSCGQMCVTTEGLQSWSARLARPVRPPASPRVPSQLAVSAGKRHNNRELVIQQGGSSQSIPAGGMLPATFSHRRDKQRN